MIDFIVETYNEIYSKVNNYLVEDKEKNLDRKRKLANTLLSKFDEVDEELIINYILFQFERYKDTKTRFGKGKIQFNWIVGDKAYQRWTNKSTSWKYWVTSYEKKIGYQRKQEKEEINHEGKLEYERRERRRFYNDERGYVHCQENELFDRFSNECFYCQYKEICRANE